MTLFFRRLLITLFLSFIFIANAFTQNYADSSNAFFISDIELKGNKVTKDEIIHRELLFEVGDKIQKSELLTLISRSKENLLNTALFNFVTIEYTQGFDKIKISIEIQERWYIWPYPVLEHADRNFSSFLKNQEWSRIDYGLFVLINNFRGRKETLIFKSIFGHNNRYNLYYYKPFIDKKKKLGLGFDIDYSKNHEIPFLNIHNEFLYLKLSKDYSRKIVKLTNFYTYRPKLNTNHLLKIKYTRAMVSDSVIALNNNYFFDNKDDVSFFSLGYGIDFDKRDSKIYPLNGFKTQFSIIKNGIGLLGSGGNLELRTIIEENYQLSDKFFINTSLLGKLNFNDDNSFYFAESIGYKNYLRGMEYYVAEGDNYYISKSNLKYEIIPQTNFDIGFISSKKFSKVHYALYFNVFIDTGYAYSEKSINSKLTNDFLYSGGVGIDLVTYYDKVLRIEYSLNKFGEHGIFFHLGAPIIDD